MSTSAITLFSKSFSQLVHRYDYDKVMHDLIAEYLKFIGAADIPNVTVAQTRKGIPDTGRRGMNTLEVYVIPALLFYVRIESLEFWSPGTNDFRLRIRGVGAKRNKVSCWASDTQAITVIADMLAKVTGVNWLRKLVTKNSLTSAWMFHEKEIQALIAAGMLQEDFLDLLFERL